MAQAFILTTEQKGGYVNDQVNDRALGKEMSIFYIKPEAMPHAGAILSQLKEAGFDVKHAKFMLAEHYVEELYSDKSYEIRTLLHKQLDNKVSILGTVEAPNALDRLVEVTGHSSDSSECSEGTIRNRYGSKSVIRENAIHRPKTKEELQKNIAIFKSHLHLLS